MDIAETKENGILPNKALEMNAKLIQQTAASLRSVYAAAKERLSFKKRSPLITLQELNGAKMVLNHGSDHSCAEILSHIGQ